MHCDISETGTKIGDKIELRIYASRYNKYTVDVSAAKCHEMLLDVQTIRALERGGTKYAHKYMLLRSAGWLKTFVGQYTNYVFFVGHCRGQPVQQPIKMT